jgi:hypothetical protein
VASLWGGLLLLSSGPGVLGLDESERGALLKVGVGAGARVVGAAGRDAERGGEDADRDTGALPLHAQR